jgi:hypothetical protein
LEVESTDLLLQRKNPPEPLSNLHTKPPANYKSKSGKLLKPVFSKKHTPGKQHHIDVEPSPLLRTHKTPPEPLADLDKKPAYIVKGTVSNTSTPNNKAQMQAAPSTHLRNAVHKKGKHDQLYRENENETFKIVSRNVDGSKDEMVREGDEQKSQDSNNKLSNKRKFVDYYIVGCNNVASMPTRVTEKHHTVTSVNRTIQPRREASETYQNSRK